MRMHKTGMPTYPRTIFAVAIIFVAFLLSANSASAKPQSGAAPGLLITPSTVVLLAGEDTMFSAVDESGRPASNVHWSITPSIADLNDENGTLLLQAKQAGHAVITAVANNQSAIAEVSIVSGTKLPAGTVRWSLQPMPGFQTLLLIQAVPTGAGPVFYSIEWSNSENAIVRALSESGQQIWMTHLASTASPLTLKHRLPAPGQVSQNEVIISDHSMFIIGTKKTAFIVNNATDANYRGLPVDGKSILIHTSADDSGGMMLLERGRFRDSLVDLSPSDGSELWRYSSEGRLAKNWTVNGNGDVGIVEALSKPPSSALLILNARTGQLRFHIPFPTSSSTLDGFRCQDPRRNILKSFSPSDSGAIFTSNDTNIYVQVETRVESVVIEACQGKQYSFDDTLALLRVTPAGETDWRTFQHIHADGPGDMVAQPRAFAGESIPDGLGGVLAAWTYFSPDNSGGQIRTEARLSRIGPSGQQDFTLPMPYWTKGINSFFDENMILGEGNVLYAINGPQLLRFDIQAGEVNWVRHPPTGQVELHHSTRGGGLLVSNAGRLVYFDAQGNGVDIPWTVAVSNPQDVGLVQKNLFDQSPMEPLQLKDVQLSWAGEFFAVEDGAPFGHGALLSFTVQ
jgi:outer membrane protein assembly factor BamB